MAQANGPIKTNKVIPSEEINTEYELEKNLFTKILRISENDSQLIVDNVHIAKATKTGDNYMSVIQRAHVEAISSNGNYFRKHFILKRQLEATEKNQIFLTAEVWANEEQMYKEILPQLRQHCIFEMPHPTFYYSDPKIMVLEDLNERLYTMGDRLTGLNLNQTLLVMKKLAAFHAASLAMQKIDPAGYSNIKKNFHHPYNSPDYRDLSKLFVLNAINDAINVIESEINQEKYSNVLESLRKVAADHNKYVPLLMKAPDSDLSVLIHGDLWINNILFTYDRTNQPADVKFVDFQASRMGSVIMDILHVIFTSVKSEIRKSHFDFIFMSYYKYLISHLKDYLGNGNDDYIRKFTYDRLEAELFTYRMYGLLNAMATLPMITCESTNSEKPKSQVFNGDATTKRFKQFLLDVVDDYIQFDWVSLD